MEHFSLVFNYFVKDALDLAAFICAILGFALIVFLFAYYKGDVKALLFGDNAK